MKTLAETPTEPRDYAALSLVYASALALIAARARTRGDRRDPMPLSELAWDGAATFALAQALVHEKIETWLRHPFLEEVGSDQEDAEHRPRGRGLRFAVGELLSCTRCSGAWASLTITGLHVASPAAGRIVTRVLAGAAANDFLETTFTWARERANDAAGSRTHSDRQTPAATRR